MQYVTDAFWLDFLDDIKVFVIGMMSKKLESMMHTGSRVPMNNQIMENDQQVFWREKKLIIKTRVVCFIH